MANTQTEARNMVRWLIGGIAALFLTLAGPALAQSPICFKTSSSQIGCTPVTSTTSPLPVSGSLTPYPVGGTVITGNATGTTGAVVGTLAGVSAKTTYIAGFSVSALGGTATVGPITVAGLVTSSMVWYMASTATGNTLTVMFNPPIPASATATAITVTTTADGTASNVAVNSWGFQL